VASSSKSQASPALLAAAAALFALLVFGPALRNGFAYDDGIVVQNHPQVTAHAWGEIWASPYHTGREVRASTGIYRPLTITSFACDHLLFGGGPVGFHATNVLLHGVATALVVLLPLRLGWTERCGLVAGALFAVHPVHVEAVAALAGRADVLATLLVLVAALLALPPPGAPVRGLPAAGAFLAALFAKEGALPAVALLPVLPLLRGSSTARRDALRLALACAAAAAVYLAVRGGVLGSLTLPAGAVTFYENPIFGQPLTTRVLTVLGVFARAGGLLAAPVRLSPDYGFAVVEPARGAGDGGVIAGAFLILGVVAAAWAARRQPVVPFLLAWCVVSWLIVSNLFVVIGTPLAERQLYLPSVGVCLLAALAWERVTRIVGHRIATGALAVVLLGALLRTTTWTRAWASDATLFAAAVESAPRSIRVLGNLGVEQADAGHFEEARALLARAVAIAPNFVPNLVNLAGVELDLRHLQAARTLAERAVAVDPRSAAAHAQLGAVRSAAGDLDGAVASFQEAVRLDPGFIHVRKRLDDILRQESGSAPPLR